MDMTLILIVLSAAAGLMYWGVQQKRTVGIVLGMVLVGGIFMFFSFLSFLGDALWFESLGFADRFWKLILFRAAFAAMAGCFGCAALWLMTLFLFARKQSRYRWIPAVIGLYLGAQWGAVNWDVILLYLNGTTSGGPGAVPDKGFYLFTLPFYGQVYVLLLGLCLAGVVCIFGGLFMTFKNGRVDLSLLNLKDGRHSRQLSWVSVNIALFLMVLGWGHSLERFHLPASSDGTAASVALGQEFTRMAGLDDVQNNQFSIRLPVGSDPQWNADPGMYCAEQIWEIKKRVKTLAPFLYFNDEPYIVLAERRLYWMLNASTASSNSYSRPFLNLEAAYQRSGLFQYYPKMNPERTASSNRISVMAVIETDHGGVSFYICQPEDPLIAVWSGIFPELFKHKDAMSALFQPIRVRSDEQAAASAR